MGYAGSPFHQGPGPQWINDPLKPFGPPDTFCNTEQSVTLTCPEGTTGDPITVTKEAGTYCGYATQELANAAALAAAQAEAEALREENPCVEEPVFALWGWGQNQYSMIGVGNTTRQLQPVLVGSSVLEFTQISVSSSASYGIKSDGTLWSWGENFVGQLGQGDTTARPYPTVVGTDSDWVKVSAGGDHVIALKSDGTLWAWGDNADGGLGLGDNTDRDVPTQVGADVDWAILASGILHSMAMKGDGTLWATGDNTAGQLGIGSTVATNVFTQVGTDTDWSVISAGRDYTAAVKTGGTLWMWGTNEYGQFGDGGTSPTQQTTPIQIGTDTNWAEVSCSVAYSGLLVFSSARKTDGTIWTTGTNTSGQLGNGTLISTVDFGQVGSDTDWTGIKCGAYFCAASKSDGTLWGWGSNNQAQLGQGGISTAESTPLQMGSDNLWSALVVGGYICFGLRNSLITPPPPAGGSGIALGGTYDEVGGNTTHTFDADGELTVLVETAVDILMVGGGGGGGGLGGGGAGEFLKLTSVTLPVGTYPGVVPIYSLGSFGAEDRGVDGGDVSFNGTTVVGGGGGGAGAGETESDATGADGASSGGGGTLGEEPFTAFGAGAASAGNVGGSAANTVDNLTSAGGGGGGNGGAGTSGSISGAGTGGNGGSGTADGISGASVTYCRGGGGASGAGGPPNGASRSTNTRASSGTTPGSGGGGSYRNEDMPPAPFNNGGNGAAGVVIISYPTPP